jgi:hypothetical protein
MGGVVAIVVFQGTSVLNCPGHVLRDPPLYSAPTGLPHSSKQADLCAEVKQLRSARWIGSLFLHFFLPFFFRFYAYRLLVWTFGFPVRLHPHDRAPILTCLCALFHSHSD